MFTIPKIKVLSIAHYSSSAEGTLLLVFYITQVPMGSIGLALYSLPPMLAACASIVAALIHRITTIDSMVFLSAV